MAPRSGLLITISSNSYHIVYYGKKIYIDTCILKKYFNICFSLIYIVSFFKFL